MKIYRDTFSYNNNDTCEWERWRTEKSSWYIDKSLAEQHKSQLERFRDYLLDYYKDSSIFKCGQVEIEEQEIAEEFKPLHIKFNEQEFPGFDYIENYVGPVEITEKILEFTYILEDPFKNIYLKIGDEKFRFYFGYGKSDIKVVSNKNTKFHKLSPEIKEKLLNSCYTVANQSLYNLYKDYKQVESETDNLANIEDKVLRDITYEKYENNILDTIFVLVEKFGFELKLSDSIRMIEKRRIDNHNHSVALGKKIEKLLTL